MSSSLSKPKIYTVQTIPLLDEYDVSNSIVVVIDILRASSTIVAGLHNQLDYIIPSDSIELCRELAIRYDAYTAGERNGQKIKDFDFGNSPVQLSDKTLKKNALVLTTTNGTQMLKKAERLNAKEIIVGSFLNVAYTAKYLQYRKLPVLFACSGWKNRINLEDVLLAGAIVGILKNEFDYTDCDSSLAAMVLYNEAKKNMSQFYQQLTHYKRLLQYNVEEDIKYSFRHNICDIIVRYEHGKLIACEEIDRIK